MEARYDPGLVVVSVLVAMFASYVALDLTARLNAARVAAGPRWEQITWGLGGALAMGTGIWSMHFIAMLALELPTPVRYGLALTIASILPAVGASALALFISSRPEVSQRAVFAGGLCMGVGIAAMHYTGMAAIVLPAGVHYHSTLYWLSVAIAVVASWAALTLAFVLRAHVGVWMPHRALAAVVMGFAIAGMHYTGMAAARFPATGAETGATLPGGVLATRGLAVAVALGAVSILALALAGAAVSVRVKRQEDARRARTEEMLRRAAEALAVTGPDFFQRALAELMRVLSATLGVIARVEDGMAETLVLMRSGEVVANIRVPLEGGPFAHVLSGGGAAAVADGIAQRFPEPWLRAAGAAGYIGIPVTDPDGHVVGLIAIFTPHPLTETGESEALLQLFATRVAGEMQQQRTEAALRESEQRLFQGEKMEAIGQLAGGVAHDFNNVLTVILGYGDELLAAEPRAETAEQLREMLAAADRAKQLTHQLLAFSRSQVLQPRPIAIDDVVASVQSMLRRLIGEDVTIVTRPGSAGSAIHADPGQMSQVLVNLAVNARDAMPLGGTLSIETDRIHHEREVLLPGGRAIPPGRYVRLIVRDTGQGMDQATRDRIFEPFFSTKGSGGTGLGLATVYGIVRQSGGFIGCESRPGAGTTFTVHFPESDEPAGPAAPAPPPLPVRRGRESILIVEDEPAVRQFLESVLTRRGYATRAVESPADALALLESGWKPDLMLTDFVLPGGMNGGDLALAATRLYPDLRIVLMSGYSKEPVALGGALPARAFLQKPFTPDVLCAVIRDALGGE